MIGKKIIYFIFLCSVHSFSQTVIVDYVFNSRYLVDKDGLDFSQNKETLFSKLNFQLLNSIKYRLIHSGHESIFFSPEDNSIFLNDEDIMDFKDLSISKMASVTYKDFSKGQTLQREFILDKAFVIKDILNRYEWTLLSDQKKINGINCKLAKSEDVFGTVIFVWYSEDIPIINGPSIYHNLPGLIVQVNSEKFDFELVSIKYLKTNINIAFTEKGEFIKQNDFVELLKRKLEAYNIEY